MYAAARAQLKATWLKPGSVRARLATGAVWSLSGAVLGQSFGLVTSMLTARVLGKTHYGELGMIRSTVEMFGIFAGIGLGLTATKYVAELRNKDAERTGRIISLCLLSSSGGGAAGALLLAGLAPLVADSVLHAPQLRVSLAIASLLLAANVVAGVQRAVLAGFEAFRETAVVTLVQSAAGLPLVVGGALGAGVNGAICGLLAPTAIVLASGAGYGRKVCSASHVRLRPVAALAERAVLDNFSLPALLSTILTGPATWWTNAMVARRPGGYAELGVFQAANQWRSVFLFVPSVLGYVATPLMSSLWGEKDVKRTRRILLGAMLASGMVALPVLLLLLVFTDPVMAAYGSEFRGRGGVLRLTAVTGALVAVQSPVGNFIAASGRMWLGVLMNGGWAAVLLATTWLLLARGWGADGLALAYLIAYAVHSVWVMLFSSRQLRSSAWLGSGTQQGSLLFRNIPDLTDQALESRSGGTTTSLQGEAGKRTAVAGKRPSSVWSSSRGLLFPVTRSSACSMSGARLGTRCALCTRDFRMLISLVSTSPGWL